MSLYVVCSLSRSDINLFGCVQIALQDILDDIEYLFMEHDIKVGQPSELSYMDRLLLVPNPTFTKAHAKTVHSVIPISIYKVHRVLVGKILIINVGYRSWKSNAIHTPHFNTRWYEITGEVLGVLPHIPESNKRMKKIV